jgi:hypothetical protein
VHAGKSDGESVVALDFKPHGVGSELRLAHELPPSWASFTEQSVQAWNARCACQARDLGR